METPSQRASELETPVQYLNKHIYIYIYKYLPGTEMALVLIGKDHVLEGSTTKMEDKQVLYIRIVPSKGSQL